LLTNHIFTIVSNKILDKAISLYEKQKKYELVNN